MGSLSVARYHQNRTPVSFHDAGCSDAYDATVPAIAVNHHAEGIAQRGFTFYAGVNRFQNAPFFFLPFGIELVEFVRQFARPGFILHTEQFDDVAGHIHAAGGVDARSDTKSHFTGGQMGGRSILPLRAMP